MSKAVGNLNAKAVNCSEVYIYRELHNEATKN